MVEQAEDLEHQYEMKLELVKKSIKRETRKRRRPQEGTSHNALESN